VLKESPAGNGNWLAEMRGWGALCRGAITIRRRPCQHSDLSYELAKRLATVSKRSDLML